MLNNYVFKYAKKYLLISFLIMIFAINFKLVYLASFSLIYIYLLFYFFRKPERVEKPDKNYIFAPSYGKVIKIIETDNQYQVAIFINLWDIHIQYVPYDGKITSQIYKEGKFNPAFLFEKGKDNEQLIHNISTEKGKIQVVQVAGIIARSIVSFKKNYDNVKQNEELGLIKFGSMCVLTFPKINNQKILIKEKQQVKGGITKIYNFV
jgi:phosphatidylserine decarboxylase